MVEVLADAAIPRTKLIYIPHPVELPASDESTSKIQRRLIFAGRLSREKGPDMMLDLAERFDDVEVVLAGEGPMTEQLRQDARARQISNVKFAGWLDKAELRRLFAESAATVIPSRCTEINSVRAAGSRRGIVPSSPSCVMDVSPCTPGKSTSAPA